MIKMRLWWKEYYHDAITEMVSEDLCLQYSGTNILLDIIWLVYNLVVFKRIIL